MKFLGRALPFVMAFLFVFTSVERKGSFDFTASLAGQGSGKVTQDG